jgi:sulfide:quinone oxidoreductase
MTNESQFKVVIAGGGVAALETALALRELAGDRVDMTLLSPAAQFVYRPMTVREPFANAPARRYELATLARDIPARLIADSFSWVDPVARTAHAEAGAELAYDALVMAIGARTRPALAHALTIDDRRMDELLHGLIQDVEGGYLRRIAFVVPGAAAWPLPIYELALMTARRAYDMNVSLDITVVTPADGVLAMFGAEVGEAVSELLDEAGIATVACANVRSPLAGQLALGGGRTLRVDRVIAAPELSGPAVRGLPGGERGFIPVDGHGAVRGVAHVYAAGDATDHAIKHGGMAAAQADVVAEAIAALAGADVTPTPLRSEIHGVLLTGSDPRYLTASLVGARSIGSHIDEQPSWPAPTKITARRLTPFLATHD